MPNLYLNIKYETVLFKKCQIQQFVTSPLLTISNLTARKTLEILKIAEIVDFKGSGPTYEVKIVFLDNPSMLDNPHTLRSSYGIK